MPNKLWLVSAPSLTIVQSYGWFALQPCRKRGTMTLHSPVFANAETFLAIMVMHDAI